MTRMLLLLAPLLLGSVSARADDQAELCYNYGCTQHARVNFAAPELEHVAALFKQVQTPSDEREAIAYAMAWMYFLAGQQTPIWHDRGGNFADAGVDGRMDCIDHSTNTTTWLGLLKRHGWLRFYDVGERIERGRLLSVHWGARIIEAYTRQEFVVDTWFLDPGYPATIYPLSEWLDGKRPPGTELFRWN